jgi:diaminohydroxyphosphoribosylaminopyrimidine deaminase/5-amino-6-(5-phosphoribosylamino)uracil reductase
LSGATLTSAATVLADDPRLDVRLDNIERQPLRVILDRRRRVRPSAKILALPGEALVFAAATKTRRAASEGERLGAARVERLRATRSQLDLTRVFSRLAELEINEVLVEAGPRLSGALIAAGLVDEWLVYLAPKLLGRDAKPLATLARITKLDAAPQFELCDTQMVGPDVRLRLRPRPQSAEKK